MIHYRTYLCAGKHAYGRYLVIDHVGQEKINHSVSATKRKHRSRSVIAQCPEVFIQIVAEAYYTQAVFHIIGPLFLYDFIF
jgi:hypothetical protein